jgi:hypothetical protein
MGEGTVPMQCTHCHRTAEFSPLRLGKVCGQCKTGKWIPKKKEVAMKDQNGREINREFAPNKRNPDDKYKVRVVEKESEYDITTDDTGRPVVKPKEK